MRTQVQGCKVWSVVGALLAVGLYGCPGDTELATGDASEGDGDAGGGGVGGSRVGASGSGGRGVGNGGAGGGAAGSSGGGVAGGGSAGSSSGQSGAGGGAAGSGGDDSCPPGVAIPAICQLCADGTSCGQPVCKGGAFTGDFACPGEGGGAGSGGTGGGDSGGCVHGGCSNQLCVEASDPPIASTCEFREEYACYQAAECARQADGQCGFTESQTLTDCLAGGGGGGLKWFATCGDPVCSSQPDPDDPAVPNCTNAMQIGSACDNAGERCETGACGGSMVCAARDPVGLVGCPISRARYKQQIEYLDDTELQSLHDEVTHLPLATWQYKHAPGVPRLGFIIDDIEPSAAVAGDRVDVYGYLSMAVAAIQVQQGQIEALQTELAALRKVQELQPDPAALVCGP